jgi:hypothetical protein
MVDLLGHINVHAVELVYKMKNQKGLAILMHGMSTNQTRDFDLSLPFEKVRKNHTSLLLNPYPILGYIVDRI